jgi:DNA-binding SARP family transcriptional activator
MPQRLAVLGAARLGPDTPLPADRRGLLLALLAAEGGWVDRDRVALLFWPDADESSARAALRQLLVRIRRLRFEPALESTSSALRWAVDSDLANFRRSLADGDPEAAVAAYAGPFLLGLAAYDVGGVDAWIEAERAALHRAFHGAATQVADVRVLAGRYGEAAALLERLEALDPLAEDVAAALMRAHYLAGRRDAALRAYERFAARLDSELGLEPLATTRALNDAVRAGAPVNLPVTHDSTTTPRRLAPSRLLARDAERATLLDARTPAVVVAGEPGIGKSALLRDTFADALWTGGAEGLEALPYHPLVALVRQRPELAAGLGAYREDLARLVPEAAPELTPAPVDAGAGRGRLAEALARFVEASGARLGVDDLQWADAATLEVLGYLVRRGVRVVGAYRSGEAPAALRRALAAWREAGALSEVTLGPLPEEAVRALIGDLMGRAEGPPVFAGALHRRSGGNPLFLLETLQALFEARVLRADETGWHTDVDDVTRDYAELAVPARVGEVIARRLAHLDDATLRVLEALAVAQADLGAARLSRATGLSAAAVADALDAAVATGFLEPGPGAAGGTGRPAPFRHDLLRQALAERLPVARRRLLHARLAEVFDDADPGRRAEHWWGAGEPSRARGAWLAQAAALRGRGLQADALAVLEAARARLPEGVDAAWLRVEASLAALEAGSTEQAAALLGDIDDTDGPPELRLKVALARVALAFHRGSVGAAQALIDAAAPLAELVVDEGLGLEYTLQRARAAKEGQRYDEAIALMEPAVARLRERRPDLRRVQFVSSLAALYDDTARAELALPLHRECLALAKALGSRYYQVEVSINLLFCTADLGRYDEAAAWAEEALNLGDYDNVPVLRTNLAANYFQAGRYAEAARHYAVLAEQERQPHLQVIALARSAECAERLGRAAEVPVLLDRALDRVPHTDFRVAVGSAAIAVLRLGDDRQVARLRALVPGLDPAGFPPHQRERLAAALAARADRA